VIDAYEIVKEHGQGGFGVTYLARRRADGLPVIVKTLKLERLKEWKSLELFEREAEVLRGLRHPGIAAYIDSFSEGAPAAPSVLGIVQEYIPGEDLARRMKRGARLGEAEMISWFAQILEVLAYLHALSPPVIHRDVTPKNVIVRPDGRAFLVDFGAVQAAVLSSSTLASTAAGTFGYAPMEQFMGRAFPASDLYGLAMTYLAVATGKEPEELPLDGVRVNVREALRANARLTLLLTDMTEPDPGRRLASAGEALDRLAPLRPASPVAAPRSPPPPPVVEAPPPRPPARSPPRELVVDAASLRAQERRVGLLAGRKAEGSGQVPELEAVENFVLAADGSKLLVVTIYGKGWVIDCATLEARAGKMDRVAMNDERQCLSPDLRLRASRKGDTHIHVFEVATKKQLQTLRVEEPPRWIGFSPDAHLLVSVGAERLELFGQKGERLRTPGSAIAFAADGRRVAIGPGTPRELRRDRRRPAGAALGRARGGRRRGGRDPRARDVSR
jgi:serine/threonine protein kinase